MIVKSLWITRKSEPEYPELLEAWDEYSIDQNPEGFEEACDEAIKAVGTDVEAIRYIDMFVAHQDIDKAFAPPVVTTQISYRDDPSGASK